MKRRPHLWNEACELDQLLGFIERQSPKGVQSVQAWVQANINLLLRHPQAGQMKSKPPLRRFVASPYPYVVFYRAAGDEVVLYSIHHSSQRPLAWKKIFM